MAKLVRKQVYLTAEQQAWLRRTAAQERRPEAEIIRDALDARLSPKRAPYRDLAQDSLWRIVGSAPVDQVGRDAPRDVSNDVDHYLYGAPKR